MYTLKLKVQNKELKIISEDDKKESFIKGSFNIDKLEFDFSEEWDKLSKKVIYKAGDKSYAEAVIDNTAIVPAEVYTSAGFVEISVVGFANENGKDTIVLPTNTIRKIVYDTNSNGEEPSNLPDESTWDKYQKKIEDLAEEAKKAEANAKTSAEAAENVKNEVEKDVAGFDKNVEEKTSEFNKNAEEKTTEFDKNTEQLYKDLEALESLAPLSTEAGTTINIDNAKAYKMMGETVDGKYQQETTTGKNKLSKDNLYSGIFTSTTGGDDSFTQSKGYCCTKKINLYSATNITISGTQFFDMYAFYDKNNALIGSAVVKASTPIPKGATTVRVRFYKSTSDLPVETLKNENIQIEFNSVATPYEPYTGGQPSPDPDYPQEITQINSAVLNRCGKNMCLTTLKTYDWKGITVEKLSDDKYKVNGTAETALDIYIANKIKIPLAKDMYYKLSKKMWSGTSTDSNNGLCNCRMRTPNSSTWAWLQSSLPTAKKAPEDAYVDLVVFAVGKGITYTDYVFSVQLEEVESASSSATEYKAYNGQSINIDLNGNEICALSDTIKDQLIIDKNGNVALQKNVAKLVLDGTETNWHYNTTQDKENTVFFQRTVNKASTTYSANSVLKYSNTFQTSKTVWNQDVEGLVLQSNNQQLMLRINRDRLTDISVDSLKAWLSDHNVITYYPLNVPQIIELPKLTEIPTMLDGINHTWTETNIGLTNIEIKYVENLQIEIEKLKIAIVALGGV